MEGHGAYVSRLTDDMAGDARAGRQVTEYVGGITRWKRRLDFTLDHFFRGDISSIELMLLQILRVGLYDLTVLDKPPHAAINEAVELAKKLVRPGAGGLVNGILRNVQRSIDTLPEPRTGDRAEDLAIEQSHPTWLVRRWLERFGTAKTGALLRWDNNRPIFGLRRNALRESAALLEERLRALDVSFEPSPFLEDFYRISGLQPIVRSGMLADGAVAVQDESAGLVVRVLDPRSGEVVVDVCAAPGGKTRYAAERMNGEGVIYAYDANESRMHLLKNAAAHQGLAMIHTEVADVRDLAAQSSAPRGDRVLLDAPCSGLGVLARRADLRWQRSPEDLRGLTALQDSLLDASATLVGDGGMLVYSTCTIAPEENEERIEAFLSRSPNFVLESAVGLVPNAMLSKEGYFASLPHEDGIDGAFAARLRKK